MMRGYWITIPAFLTAACGGAAKQSDRGSSDSSRPAASPVAAAADDSAGARARISAGGSAGAAAPSATGDSGGAHRAVSERAASPGAAGERSMAHKDGRADTRAADSTVAAGGSDAADTARGIVAVVGTSFDSHVILRQRGEGGGEARSVSLAGPQARAVGALSGVDVWVSGTRDESGRLTVSRFVVRAVDGAPAMDGTLIAHGQRLLLVTRDGKQHPIENPPPALREHVGARVWVTGSLERGPITFGVVRERS